MDTDLHPQQANDRFFARSSGFSSTRAGTEVDNTVGGCRFTRRAGARQKQRRCSSASPTPSRSRFVFGAASELAIEWRPRRRPPGTRIPRRLPREVLTIGPSAWDSPLARQPDGESASAFATVGSECSSGGSWRARCRSTPPDARPIRKGKLGKPTEFGYVDQLCEITANTRRGARGFVLPPKSQIGNPAENTLLPDTAAEIKNLDITLKEIVLDGGFMPTPSNTALAHLTDTIHITGRQEQVSRRSRRRRQRYRTGAEGRISHLKRGYGLDRSRLKGDTGHQIWASWAALSYNAETYTTLG